jgi:hypothetical protein
MSVACTYRRLLSSIKRKVGQTHNTYFTDYVRTQFRASANVGKVQADGLLVLAQEFSQHLDETTKHTEVLKRYNITVNLDSSQRRQVEHIAKRVGLVVPTQQ